MKYIAIDTSNKHLTVIVNKDGKIFSEFLSDNGTKHSVTLMSIAERLLDKAQISLSEMNFIACVVGAGSFTGIRIGISTVKALCFSLKLPFLSITSFDTIAYNKGKGKVLAVIDAGHGGFYVCGYNQTEISLTPRYILKKELLSLKKEYTLLSGEKIEDLKTQIVSVENGLINAIEAKSGQISFDYSNLNPLYIRKSQAEEGRP